MDRPAAGPGREHDRRGRHLRRPFRSSTSPGERRRRRRMNSLRAPIIRLPMASYTQSIQNLMNELARLPGIGARSAERIAFHLLKLPAEEAMRLADAIHEVKTRIKHCSTCYNLTEQDPCAICSDPARDQAV